MDEHKTLTKREKVVMNLVTNGGNMNKAVVDAGYSVPYADSGKITKTKKLQDLIERVFPPDELIKFYTALLNKKESAQYEGGIYVGEQPHSDVSRILDMINKLQGNYAPDKIQLLDRYEGLSDEELAERKAELDHILKRDDT